MATTVSIPGGNGAPPLIFKITGTSAGNYGTEFANTLQNAANLRINVLSNPGVMQTSVPAADIQARDTVAPSGNVVLNEILTDYRTPTSVQGTPYTLMYGNEFTVVDVGVSTTVVGSAMGGDTVLATGAVTYDATGSNNNVDFISGTNLYNGSTVAGATGDTITGGSGYDTINTGTGSSTVFSGSGHTLINLQDTATGGSVGGLVYLGDGMATVYANGANDFVDAGTNGQTIYGSSVASSVLTVNITDNATSSGPAGDVISAGAGTTNVFDSVGGNTIFGGTGTLAFVGGAAATGTIGDTIVGGTGNTVIFGAAGDSISFSGDNSGNTASFTAGMGNETLNAADAGGRVNFFGSSDSAGSSLFVGSTSGFNYYQTGGSSTVSGDGGASTTVSAGTETIVGGNGTNVFGIQDGGANAHVTIYDFAAGNDSVSFLGETAAQVTADLNAATTTTNAAGQPDLTVTLSDQSTVTFVGISSLNGHIISH